MVAGEKVEAKKRRCDIFMKADIFKKKKNKIVVRIKNSSFEYVNSLRRACMDLVPTLAVEYVRIGSNNSALYDEVLAHRLGLIPLKTDLKSYDFRNECKCDGEGCPRCTVNFTLKKEGPSIAYSGDMVSSDPEIKPVFDNIVIVKLFENQEVEFEATAVLGRGRTHAKWSPCLAYYKYTPDIKINNHKVKDAEKIVNSCHKKVFKKKTKTTIEINKKNLFDCDLCKKCTEVSEGIKLKSNDKDVLFMIESWGQLSPEKIYEKALGILDTNLEEFKKKIKS